MLGTFAMNTKPYLVLILVLSVSLFRFLAVSAATDVMVNDVSLPSNVFADADGLTNSEVQYQIGLNYAAGIGVTKDDEKAARWY
jgi:TPR repeat protein